MKDDETMHVDISGGRMQLSIVLSGLVAILISIGYSISWWVKLDDRVHDNSELLAEQRAVSQQHQKLLQQMEVNMSRTAVILENLVQRVEKLEDK